MDVSISVSSPGFGLFLLSPKNTLWQASTEDQLRNIGMPSFVTVTAYPLSLCGPDSALISDFSCLLSTFSLLDPVASQLVRTSRRLMVI